MSVFRAVASCARGLSMCRPALLRTSADVAKCTAGNRSFSHITTRTMPAVCMRSPISSIVKQISTAQRMVQTKSDQEMSDFLSTEIQSEKDSLKATGKAVQVKGFDVQTKEAEVTLTRKFQDETVKVVVNVNHAVDAEALEDQEAENPSPPAADPAKMVCRPEFHVEIIKGGSTLAFNCSMASQNADEDMTLQDSEGKEYQDLFNVEEFSIYKGEYKESTYVIAGEVMDGNFYDNLMNMLDERGINSEFVQQVIDFCTLYEQKLYVNLLEDLQEIVKSK